MGFAQESGYTPISIESLMLIVMDNVNTQFGQSYTSETFIGTNWYKFYYALIQRLQESEVKTSEIFTKLQQYIAITNERISRPVVTNPGLISALSVAGYLASIKKPISADAGKIYVCVDAIGATTFTAQTGAVSHGGATFQAATANSNTATSLADQINNHAVASLVVRATAYGAKVYVRSLHGGTAGNAIVFTYTDNDTNVGATLTGSGTLLGGTANADYNDIREEICGIIKDSTVAGAVTQGTEEEAIVLSNGQSFDFKYNLPNLIRCKLKLTLVLSENNQVFIQPPDITKQRLLDKILATYGLGKNFEPQRYFSVVDAPWAQSVLLEYSNDDGSTYASTVFDANYDDLFDIDLANIELIET